MGWDTGMNYYYRHHCFRSNEKLADVNIVNKHRLYYFPRWRNWPPLSICVCVFLLCCVMCGSKDATMAILFPYSSCFVWYSAKYANQLCIFIIHYNYTKGCRLPPAIISMQTRVLFPNCKYCHDFRLLVMKIQY